MRRASVLAPAIQNAASVAALLITTEAMIAELPKKNAEGPAMPTGWRHGRHSFLRSPCLIQDTKGAVQTAPFFWVDPIPSSFRQCAQAQAGCPVGGKGFFGH